MLELWVMVDYYGQALPTTHPALVVTEGEVATNCYIYKYRYTPIILKKIIKIQKKFNKMLAE